MTNDRRRGLILIDKDPGPSSFHTIAQLRRLLGIKKIGHAGTLDPFASGLLLIAYGKATSALERLTSLDKSYEVTIRFGQATDTGDSEGEIVAEQTVDLVRDLGEEGSRLKKTLSQFKGEQWQTPPMHSAIKVQGQRLYELARRGETVERPPRKIEVSDIRFVSLQPAGDFVDAVLTLDVSSGTYVRTLAVTIGESLGIPAHARELRRTSIGRFDVQDAHRLEPWFDRFNELGRDSAVFYDERLQAGDLLPLRYAFSDLATVSLSLPEATMAFHGRTLSLEASRVSSTLKTGDQVWLDYNGNDVALAEVIDAGAQLILKMSRVWIDHEHLH
ncbi:MAG TPA: tRNA pseudouridine(55) synthase TruB [Fastidiosipila sp.]|nr:tRNA pseudouridine(55) synthase TruB [Fastidiosipila sp.]